MEKKPNFRKKGYDQYLSIFVLSFLFCYIVLNLHFFASGGAKSAVFSLFIATTNFQLIPASQLQPMRGVVWILVRVDKSMFAIYPTGFGPKFDSPREILSNGSWYSTCQFFLEPIFEARMKQHGCLPNDSSLASAIYIPFYAGLDIGRCIPVFFHPGSAYVQYLCYFPSNYTKYSVFIPEEDVRSRRVNIRRRLMCILSIEVEAMREEVIGMIPRIVYANPRNGGLPDFEDAFDVAIKGVPRRIEELGGGFLKGRIPVLSFLIGIGGN
ncbi:xyloglucan galactosyltransferase MUR3-like [Punica granatum]|uniref:Xyloglucan galactosyltransferase MUR3-like n=1 Tax=Punica granatum TaxID=22663 RepID=A0A6P8C6J1_PUNGR|nr:xyloglucan galactosyltransferase MUR3-like [Punica granatum]